MKGVETKKKLSSKKREEFMKYLIAGHSSICIRYALPIPFASAGMLRLDSRVPLLGNGPFPTNYFFSIPSAGLGARSFLNVMPSFMTKTTFSIALMF